MIYAKWVEEDSRFSFSLSDNGGHKISLVERDALIAGEAGGKQIAPDASGRPVLQDRPPIQLTREQIEFVRLRAYADPISGSDRYFAEAQRESLLGNAEAAEAAKALGMARFAEIQTDNPWPAE